MPIIHKDHNGVRVESHDTPGIEGHFYKIIFADQTKYFKFQTGPVKEVGVNGITNESLLAILSDRLIVLDKQFPCVENKEAIANIEAALSILEQRTANRIARSVEGLNKE